MIEPTVADLEEARELVDSIDFPRYGVFEQAIAAALARARQEGPLHQLEKGVKR